MPTSASNSVALAAFAVSKSLTLSRDRIHILQGVDLQIQRGEFAALIRPSGSGKSTLLGVGKHPGDLEKRARAVLALVGPGHRLKNRPQQLSGGG
jgi:predicted ABC-type transport system involved in lysophospholipase L1 biosynthesis ATPase subunit